MEFTPDILNILSNGGIPIILFAIWYFTFKQSSKSYEQSIMQFKEALQQSQKQFEEAMLQNKANFDRIISIMIEDTKYKALLSEILTKVEIKIDQQNLNPRRAANG